MSRNTAIFVLCIAAVSLAAEPTSRPHPDVSKINDPAVLRNLLNTAYARIDALESQVAAAKSQVPTAAAPTSQPSPVARANSWDFVVTAISETPTDTIATQLSIEQAKIGIGQGGRGYYNDNDNSLDHRITREQDKLNEMQAAYTEVSTRSDNGRGRSTVNVQKVPKYSPAQIQQQRNIVNGLTGEKNAITQHINQLQRDLDKARATVVITGTRDADGDGTPEETIMVTTTQTTAGIGRTLYPGQHVRVGGNMTQKSPLQVTASSIVPLDTTAPSIPIRQPH
jgi:hypothetical protein